MANGEFGLCFVLRISSYHVSQFPLNHKHRTFSPRPITRHSLNTFKTSTILIIIPTYLPMCFKLDQLPKKTRTHGHHQPRLFYPIHADAVQNSHLNYGVPDKFWHGSHVRPSISWGWYYPSAPQCHSRKTVHFTSSELLIRVYSNSEFARVRGSDSTLNCSRSPLCNQGNTNCSYFWDYSGGERCGETHRQTKYTNRSLSPIIHSYRKKKKGKENK